MVAGKSSTERDGTPRENATVKVARQFASRKHKSTSRKENPPKDQRKKEVPRLVKKFYGKLDNPQKNSIQYIIASCLTTIFRTLSFYGYTQSGSDMKTTQAYYESLVNDFDGDWLKMFKYKTVAFFSAWQNQPAPPTPSKLRSTDNPKFITCGRSARFIMRIMKGMKLPTDTAPRKEAESLLMSILQVKKGLPKPNREMVIKAEAEFFETITTVPQEPEAPMVGNHKIDRETIIREIERTAQEIFGEEEARLKAMPKEKRDREMLTKIADTIFPSTSANYIYSRKDMGSVGAILELTENEGLRRPGGFLRDKANPDPFKNTTQGQPDLFSKLPYKQQNREISDFTHLKNVFQPAWETLTKLNRERAKEAKNYAEPLGLAEPFKVRVITKSDPHRQFALTFLQKWMHKVLRNHPTFSLIGNPYGYHSTLAEYLEERLHAWKPLNPEEEYISGDYKAATDNFFKWVSDTTAEAISKAFGLPEDLKALFKEALTGFTLVYKGEERVQEKGQLMGSIVSFPVLCIVNAAITRFAYELGLPIRAKVSLRDCPMAINGDDVAFRATKASRDAWRTIIKVAGLQESVGKTYYSKEFVQINSTNFVVVNTTEGRTALHLVRYVNLGLLYGLKKSGERVSLNDEDQYNTIGKRYRDLLDVCPEYMRNKVSKFFAQWHHEQLHAYRLPWYIPEWLGGYGMTGLKEPSNLDRRIATRILLNWKNAEPIPLGTRVAQWNIEQIAKERLRKEGVHFHTVEREDAFTEEYEQLLKIERLDILLDSNYKETDLFNDVEGGHLQESRERREARRKGIHREKIITKKELRTRRSKQALKHNERLWRVGKENNLPPPISLERLKFRAAFTAVGEPDRSVQARLDFERTFGLPSEEPWGGSTDKPIEELSWEEPGWVPPFIFDLNANATLSNWVATSSPKTAELSNLQEKVPRFSEEGRRKKAHKANPRVQRFLTRRARREGKDIHFIPVGGNALDAYNLPKQ